MMIFEARRPKQIGTVSNLDMERREKETPIWLTSSDYTTYSGDLTLLYDYEMIDITRNQTFMIILTTITTQML